MSFLSNIFAPIIGPAIESVIDLIPNKNERARAKETLEKAALDAANAGALAQIKVNEQEAQHASIFVAGWRPFVGWICGFGLAWSFVIHPLLQWVVKLVGSEIVPPTLQTEALISLVMAMLGMASVRSFDKLKGVARTRLGLKK